MIEALLYGGGPNAYGSSPINDTIIFMSYNFDVK
jgi:hypothetical protein